MQSWNEVDEALSGLLRPEAGGDREAEVARILRIAAMLVEHAGYESARWESTARASRIILIAAELARLGDESAGRGRTAV